MFHFVVLAGKEIFCGLCSWAQAMSRRATSELWIIEVIRTMEFSMAVLDVERNTVTV